MSADRRHAPPLLPPQPEADRPLFWVMAILTALACASAVGARATWSATGAWTAELASAVTVQIRPEGRGSAHAAAQTAADVIAGVPGVAQARGLTRSEAEALLEPWFGRGGVPDDIPLPGLVDVRLTAHQPAQARDLEAALAAAGLAGIVDDHARWARPLRRSANAARGLALALTSLLAGAASLVISHAVRASLAVRRDVVDILHLVGAHPQFIARQFQARFLSLGARAGLMGAVGAAALAGGLMIATDASAAQEYFPSFRIAAADGAILVLAPLGAAAVAAWTARATVLHALQRRV